MVNIESSSGELAHRPWQSYHTAFTNAKAGMEGVDKEKVQRIVYEMSKGSKYFENEERKEADIKQKVDNMQAQRAKLTDADISHYQKVADRKILELEATRDLTRVWLHVDMDAFYAAVETLSNPSLKGIPMAVGGMSMISTANYEARKFGVRAAMPGFIARKLCPHLIFVPVDFKKYTHFSGLTRDIFQRYDPNFMAASLDEAYLDITNICKERGITSEDVAEELRRGVYEETGLTCSAGVGPNRLLAKVCSDINKPNGQFVLPNDRMAVMTFISSLPIRKIGGIGKVTEHILKDVCEVKTCEEMLQKGGLLCALFSHSSAEFFLSVGLGLGGTETPEVRLRKSISNERTFSASNNEALFYGKLKELAARLSADMEKEGLRGRTLTLKLKTASFEVRNRAVTLPNFICSAKDILKHAVKLLKAELPISLRLIGLRMSQFNVDKDGVPSDPSQKTLSDFIISKQCSGKNVNDQSSFGSNLNDNHFVHEPLTGLFIDNNETNFDNYEDLAKKDAFLHTKPSTCSKSHDGGEIEVKNATETVGFDAEASTSTRTNFIFLPDQVEENSLNAANKRACPLDDEATYSLDDRSQILWVDEYKCVICGVELPPSFVDERQEHADFHLAERLQKEESHSPRNFIAKQRINPKDQVAIQNGRRKKLSRKMGFAHLFTNPKTVKMSIFYTTSPPNIPSKTHTFSLKKNPKYAKPANQTDPGSVPTMSEIIQVSRAQNLDLQLKKLGPFFRITAKSLKTENVLGKAEGLIRVWFGGKRILHLDSIKLERETMGMERSIFGTGLFIGAVAIRLGYDCGCDTAELLAINDSDLYHTKLVKFYTRIGFKPVYEVTGSSLADLAHQLIWGGVGTRMDAYINHLLIKWCTRFRTPI